MKKVFLFSLVMLFSFCSNQGVKEEFVNEQKDTSYTPEVSAYTTIVVDSLMIRATNLLNSTQNSEKKVHQMKKIVSENKELKKEALIMRAEIISVKKERDVLLEEVNNNKKKNLLQRVVEAIKDTTNR